MKCNDRKPGRKIYLHLKNINTPFEVMFQNRVTLDPILNLCNDEKERKWRVE